MKNYIFPVKERIIEVDISCASRKQQLVSIDGLGILVLYANELPPETELRKYLIGKREITTWLQAETLQDAIKEFNEYPQCKIGEKSKAWELNVSEKTPIIRYSHCDHLKYDKNKGITCEYFNKGDSLFCVFDFVDDPPIKCTISNQMKLNGFDDAVNKLRQFLEVNGKTIKLPLKSPFLKVKTIKNKTLAELIKIAKPYINTLVIHNFKVIQLKGIIKMINYYAWEYRTSIGTSHSHISTESKWIPLKGFIPEKEYKELRRVWNFENKLKAK